MNNTSLIFSYNSLRAKKARLAVLLEKQLIRFGLWVLVSVLLASGLFIAYSLHVVAGVLLASFAAWPLIIGLWYKFELHDIPPTSESLDGLLASDILGRLSINPSPQAIAKVVMRTQGGYFFVVRFGIGPNFLAQLSSQKPEDTQAVWERANQLRQQNNAKVISGAMLVVALVGQIPTKGKLLAQLQLDEDELAKGVAWQEHIKQLIVDHAVRKSSGGIGRDWSFGYTPMLSHFTLNVSNAVLQSGMLSRELESHQQILSQLTNLLAGGGRRNAVLVGPTGVGKTTLIYALAEQLMEASPQAPKSLHYRQVVALDPASLIAQARGRGELEELMQQLFFEAFRAKNIIIFLDEAQLFLQDGTGSVNLSNLLLPILEGGGLRMVLAMDEQRWLHLSQENPALAQYMNRINVSPPDQVNTLLVLEDQLFTLEFRYKVTYMYQSLLEAYRLGERYVQDQAMPGKAISLLEAAAQHATNGLVTAQSVQKAVEKTYGIKVGGTNTTDERTKLLQLEQLIHQRMINQTRAVTVVANALRRARAGVRNPSRPIGTFLFLGPTGVGKTELAKSLAAVYFGGEGHLVRLDLNEFGQPDDVKRLIANGAEDPHSLTAQVGKQPFSVVLLDEIEKAHPNVLNALLQLLDEGILRDSSNREVSFRDSIVIATSNAGADRIRQHISAGQPLEKFEGAFVDELIDSGQFRPEFLNRFDEIVLFRPLNESELLQIVDLMIAGINKTLASQKVSVHVADDAKRQLVKMGYDPRLGARPMRRVVQRTVEDLVARRMLTGESSAGVVIEITLADIQGEVHEAKS